jgi:hypothetical protein
MCAMAEHDSAARLRQPNSLFYRTEIEGMKDCRSVLVRGPLYYCLT